MTSNEVRDICETEFLIPDICRGMTLLITTSQEEAIEDAIIIWEEEEEVVIATMEDVMIKCKDMEAAAVGSTHSSHTLHLKEMRQGRRRTGSE